MKKIFRLAGACFISCLVLSGCHPSNKGGVEMKTIVCDNFQDFQEIHDFDLFDGFEIFQVDSTVLMGKILKICQYDSLFYLFEHRQMAVTVVNNKGKVLSRISRKGHGANEYIDLEDIFIDPKARTLNLLSRGDQKLFVYDILGRDLLAVKKMPKSFCQMQKTASGYMGYMGNYTQDASMPYNFWTLDNDLHLLKGFSEIDPLLESRRSVEVLSLSKYGNRYDGITEADYKVRSLTEGEFSYTYNFDFGDLNLPPEAQEVFKNDPDHAYVYFMKYISGLRNFQETDKYIISYFIFQGVGQMAVYNKETKSSTRVILGNSSVKDLYPLSFGRIVGMDEDKVYTYVDAEDVHRLCKERDPNDDLEVRLSAELKRLRSLVPCDFSNDNPYIVVHYFRKK